MCWKSAQKMHVAGASLGFYLHSFVSLSWRVPALEKCSVFLDIQIPQQ